MELYLCSRNRPSWPIQGQRYLCLWSPTFQQLSVFCSSRIVHRQIASCFSDVLDPYHQHTFPSGDRPLSQLPGIVCKIRFLSFLVKQDSSPTEAVAKIANKQQLQIQYMSRDRAFAISTGLLERCTKWMSGCLNKPSDLAFEHTYVSPLTITYLLHGAESFLRR